MFYVRWILYEMYVYGYEEEHPLIPVTVQQATHILSTGYRSAPSVPLSLNPDCSYRSKLILAFLFGTRTFSVFYFSRFGIPFLNIMANTNPSFSTVSSKTFNIYMGVKLGL
jgi:hypothetical protein